MQNGGIFNGPTALGYIGFGETSGGSIACSGPVFHTALQAELRKRGYSVRQDGIWDGCCQSALIKEIGGPMWSTDQVKQFLGRTCNTGYITPGNILGPGAPTTTVLPTCASGQDVKGSTGTTTIVEIEKCPSGQIFDVNLKRCVPTLDPFDCGSKCKHLPALYNDWTKCMFACNTSGGKSTVEPGKELPPGPGQEIPGSKSEVTAASVLGENLPLILGALAIGLGAVVYFGTKKKTPAEYDSFDVSAPVGRPNKRRRRRSCCR